MAVYQGAMTYHAGQLDPIFAAAVPLNPYWSIVDSAAAVNGRAYRNYDPARNVDYIVLVLDNYNYYTTIEFWDDWDAVAHAGVGNSFTNSFTDSSSTLRLTKRTGDYFLRVLDHSIVWGNMNYGCGYYIGNPTRYTEEYDLPLFVGHSSRTGTAPAINALGLGVNMSSGSYTANQNMVWQTFRNEYKAVDVIHNDTSRQITSITNQVNAGTVALDITGKVRLEEIGIYSYAGRRLLGVLDGVVGARASSDPFSNGDTVTIGATTWLAIKRSDYTSFVEMK